MKTQSITFGSLTSGIKPRTLPIHDSIADSTERVMLSRHLDMQSRRLGNPITWFLGLFKKQPEQAFTDIKMGDRLEREVLEAYQSRKI